MAQPPSLLPALVLSALRGAADPAQRAPGAMEVCVPGDLTAHRHTHTHTPTWLRGGGGGGGGQPASQPPACDGCSAASTAQLNQEDAEAQQP